MARTIHALIYSGVCFGLGVRWYLAGDRRRGLRWQALGIGVIAVFSLFAFIYLTWVNGLVSMSVSVIQGAVFARFWRAPDGDKNR
jgi:hypothetical protein